MTNQQAAPQAHNNRPTHITLVASTRINKKHPNVRVDAVHKKLLRKEVI